MDRKEGVRHPVRQAGTSMGTQGWDCMAWAPVSAPSLLTWHWAQCGMSWEPARSLSCILLLILREDKSSSFLMSLCVVGFFRAHHSAPNP